MARQFGGCYKSYKKARASYRVRGCGQVKQLIFPHLYMAPTAYLMGNHADRLRQFPFPGGELIVHHPDISVRIKTRGKYHAPSRSRRSTGWSPSESTIPRTARRRISSKDSAGQCGAGRMSGLASSMSYP